MKGLKKTTFFFGESHTLHNVHDTLRHYKLHPGGVLPYSGRAFERGVYSSYLLNEI